MGPTINERKQVTDGRSSSRPVSFAATLRMLREHPNALLGTIVFAGVIAFWIWRIQKGVDLSDESYYVSLPLRFALGDRPFLDERSSVQGSGLIELPFVAFYHLIVRSNDGLMLFMRLLYLTFLTAIGVGLANAVRGWISRGAALACGALTCFYVPYCIYQMSYNSLGGGLAMLAGLTVLRLGRSEGMTAQAASRYAMFAGVCVAASTLAYPTLMPLAAVHAVTIVLFGRRPLGWWRVLGYYVLGGGFVCLYVCLFLLRSGFGSLKLTIDFVRAWGPTLTGELSQVPTAIERFKNDWVTAFLVAGVLAGFARRFKLVVFLLAIYVPTLAMPAARDDTGSSVRYFTCLALFAPLFALLVEDKRRAFHVLATVWAPGVVTGTLTGISSGNGGIASGLGGFAGLLAGAVLACRACEEAVGRWRGVFGWTSIAAPIAVLSCLVKLASAENAVYREAKLEKLTEKVRVGPFKGLKTTPEHRKLVEQMHTDIVQHAGGGRFGLFMPDMPSAYLSANVRGAVAETWLGKIPKRNEINAALFRAHSAEIGIVGIRLCGAEYWRCRAPDPATQTDNPVYRAISETHAVVLKRDDYLLLKPR